VPSASAFGGSITAAFPKSVWTVKVSPATTWKQPQWLTSTPIASQPSFVSSAGSSGVAVKVRVFRLK